VRTTVNIDDELLAEAKVLAVRTARSLGAVIDDALRVLLRDNTEGSAAEKVRLPAHGTGGFHLGVDIDDKEALAELMGDNAAP
jgi:ABC-type lipoprotein release transport system permease subunit